MSSVGLPRDPVRTCPSALEVLGHAIALPSPRGGPGVALVPATVAVNAAANVHAIDPNIYGTAFASTAQLNDLNLPLNRNGGNASDTYSYQQDATNRGSDWFFESIASGNGNGQGMDAWINETLAGGAQPSITLNLFDWAAKNAVSSTLGSFSGRRVRPAAVRRPVEHRTWATASAPTAPTSPATTRTSPTSPNSPAIEQVWIQHLITTFGNSQNGGVQYYTLGNEPGLWNHTHRDIHPDRRHAHGAARPRHRLRVDGQVARPERQDPRASRSGAGRTTSSAAPTPRPQNWGATYNGLNAQTWLLDQMRQHDDRHRASGCSTTSRCTSTRRAASSATTSPPTCSCLRNRSTRSLWDPNYVDESWIASTGINGGQGEPHQPDEELGEHLLPRHEDSASPSTTGAPKGT